ncbi:MAG: hypothetical protein RR810_04115 [Clostridia bacterium]
MNNSIKVLSAMMFCIMFIESSIFASSKIETAVVNRDNTGYSVYLDKTLQNGFTYCIQNTNAITAASKWVKSEKDGAGKNAQDIANIANTYTGVNYLWVKDSKGDMQIDGLEIDLSLAIKAEEINNFSDITKRIKISADETEKKVTENNELKSTIVVGKTNIIDTAYTSYEYALIKLPAAKEYNTLVDCFRNFNSKKINTFDSIKNASVFKEEYNKALKTATFKLVENSEILQPENANNGEEYLLILKGKNKDKETSDMQILTSVKKVKEGVNENIVKENVKKVVKLPITADSAILTISIALLAAFLIGLLIIKKKCK